MIRRLMDYAFNYPKVIMGMTVLLVVAALAQFPRMKVDTDPENMLPADAPVRVFHHHAKKEFALYDFIVLGVVNERNAEGVFNVSTLTKVYDITEEIKGIPGVIAREIIALSTKDNIEQGDVGSVRFNWLMASAPKTEAEAVMLRREAQDHPMFKESVVSGDGKATAIYIPIEKKEISYEVAQKIRGVVRRYSGDEEYHITGLPVAEDQFGVEMFKQMAVSAPLAGLIIFLLMWYFFQSIQLIVASMLVAVVTVLLTMGLLIGLGFPVHIMSSMIPIFLMPIAVLDSVHILSEFSDKYKQFGSRQETIRHVLKELFSPMLFTSLTSVAGFYSLSFSPIPPVQVFGVFVAIGIALAWVLTILFIPAYVMLMREDSFKNFSHGSHEERGRWINKLLQTIKGVVTRKFKMVLVATAFLMAASIYGISHIRVNDNPVRWFTPAHPIRVADRILNKHFAGTYEAFLVFESTGREEEVFMTPAMLRYLDDLQHALVASGDVGKATSLVDIVKKVYYELMGGEKKNEVVPNTKAAVAQCLIAFENSHKPDDLWHVTTPDYRKANIWLQLKSGDNRDMSRVARFVDRYVEDNPPPFPVNYQWAGLTYINVIWQNNMVGGMLNNFIGSFIIVLFMMLFLFRSPFKALVSMIPLTVTILFIYSLLGFLGRDYDMPVAVLSALTLGLSVDFAIHFIQRAMDAHERHKSWEAAADEMFTGPGRAIVLNALVVAIGFLPLLAAPLIPYKTVGFFMFMIMAVSGVATLFILPAIFSINPSLMFERPSKGICFQGGQCILLGVFVAGAAAYILIGYSPMGWARSLVIAAGIAAMFSAFCFLASKLNVCLKGKGRVVMTKTLSLVILLMAAATGHAQEINVDQIVEKANRAAYYAGKDGLADVKMTITDAQGRARKREMRILRLNSAEGGEQKFYVYFHQPADVAKMVFMVWKHLGRDDDRWLYLPALDLVRRIAAGDKRSSFAGSHFVYEDVSGRGVDADTHALIETTQEFYKLKNVPNEGKGVEFAYYYVWVDRTNLMPRKAEYYNNQNKLVRVVEALDVAEVAGYATVTKSLAKDLERGGETVIEFSNIRYDVGLTEDIFEERYLRKAPVQWVK